LRLTFQDAIPLLLGRVFRSLIGIEWLYASVVEEHVDAAEASIVSDDTLTVAGERHIGNHEVGVVARPNCLDRVDRFLSGGRV